MKGIKFISAVAAILSLAFLTVSCDKSSQSLTGSYTYKISGTVSLMPTALAGLDAATLAAYAASGVDVNPVTVALYPEQGQMHIIEESDGKAVVTFNNLLGNADVTPATISGSDLTLAGTEMKSAQVTDGTDKIGGGLVIYGGKGKLLEDMLIIDMTYQGQFNVKDNSMTVVASKVTCLAQHN